jgi:hypothetical protein
MQTDVGFLQALWLLVIFAGVLLPVPHFALAPDARRINIPQKARILRDQNERPLGRPVVENDVGLVTNEVAHAIATFVSYQE